MATERRVFADCRESPSERNCSLYLAGTEEEVLETAVHHAVTMHGHQETPELRAQIKSMLKDEPAEMGARGPGRGAQRGTAPGPH